MTGSLLGCGSRAPMFLQMGRDMDSIVYCILRIAYCVRCSPGMRARVENLSRLSENMKGVVPMIA